MYCTKCGAEIPNGSKFCNNCGNPINETVSQDSNGVYFTPRGISQSNIKKQASTVIRQQKRVKGEPQKPDMRSPGFVAGLVGSAYNAKAYKGFNNYQEKLTTFVFASPLSFSNTVNSIKKVLERIGKVKTIDIRRGFIQGTIYYTRMQWAKVEFYIAQKNNLCSVRAILHNNMLIKAKDIYWDYFLMTLFSVCPNTDFGVTLCNGSPYLLAVKYLGNDTVLESRYVSSSGTSLMGFLIGDALFGTAGAIVGGMSGKQQTRGVTKETFSKRQLVKIVFNNGRIYEGEVKKNSQLYNEIMVNI